MIRPAKTLLGNDVPTKVLWFCGGHGVCLNRLFDLRDGQLITARAIEWLDAYVKGENVDTGPRFEWVDQRGQWFSSDDYPVDPGPPILASRSADARLRLIPYLGGSGLPLVPIAFKAAQRD